MALDALYPRQIFSVGRYRCWQLEGPLFLHSTTGLGLYSMPSSISYLKGASSQPKSSREDKLGAYDGRSVSFSKLRPSCHGELSTSPSVSFFWKFSVRSHLPSNNGFLCLTPCNFWPRICLEDMAKQCFMLAR